MRRDHAGMRGRDKQTLPGDMMLCQEAHDGTLLLNVHRVLMMVMVIKKTTVGCQKELGQEENMNPLCWKGSKPNCKISGKYVRNSGGVQSARGPNLRTQVQPFITRVKTPGIETQACNPSAGR